MGDQGDSNNKHPKCIHLLMQKPQSCPKTGIYGCSVRHTHRGKNIVYHKNRDNSPAQNEKNNSPQPRIALQAIATRYNCAQLIVNFKQNPCSLKLHDPFKGSEVPCTILLDWIRCHHSFSVYVRINCPISKGGCWTLKAIATCKP